jgi:phage head maturation protease
MTGEAFTIRGFAAPFEQLARLQDGSGLEMFAPFAFDLAGSPRVDIRKEHDGSPLAQLADGTLWLAQNLHGLLFEASLRDEAIWELLPSMRIMTLGASVNIVGLREGIDRRLVQDANGTSYHCIESARIDHIALCHRPTYPQTSAWLASWEEERIPADLRAEVERWHAPPQEPTRISSRGSLRGPVRSSAAAQRPRGRVMTGAELGASLGRHAARIGYKP